MPIKIIALDGLNNAKMCKLMGPLLQTIPGVDYANIDYLSQKLTLQISGRDNARIIESVTEKLKKNMPDVTIRYADTNDVSRESKQPQESKSERLKKMKEKAARVREAQIDAEVRDFNASHQEGAPVDKNENMAKALTSMMKEEIQHETTTHELNHSLGDLNTEKLAEMEASRTQSLEDEELKRKEQSEQNKQFAESIVEELERAKREERERQRAREEATSGNNSSDDKDDPVAELVVKEPKAPKQPKQKKSKEEPTQEKPSLFSSLEEDEDENEEEPFVPIIHSTPVAQTSSSGDDGEEEIYEDYDDDDDDFYEDELDEIVDEEYLERQRELEEYESELIGEKVGFFKKMANRIGRETLVNSIGVINVMIAFIVLFFLNLPHPFGYFGNLICFSCLSIYALIADHGKFKFSSWLSSLFVIAPCGFMFFSGSTTQAILSMAIYNVALIVSYLYYNDFNLGIRRSIDIAPKTLIRVVDDFCEELPFNAINSNDEIIINAGDVIPFDCVVTGGESEVDDSFITGHNEPTKVAEGSWVSCGSINLTSSLQLKVSKNQEKSAMAVIRRTFMNDSAEKLNTVSICKSYVTLLFFIQVFMVLALTAIIVATAQYEFLLDFALVSFLLLTPTGINAAIVHSYKGTLGKALKNKITILSSNALDELAKVSYVITGHNEVLNTGDFKVVSVKLIDTKIVNEEELLEMASSVESKVDSPISNAIVEYYTTNYETEINEESITSCTPYQEGIRAIFDLTHSVLVGSYAFMIQNNVLIPENTTDKICIYVAKQNTYVGSIFLEGVHREGYKTFTNDLRKVGVKNVMILTGNEAPFAEGYGKRNGYNTVLAQRTMSDKTNTITTLVTSQDKLGNIAYIGTHQEVEEFTKRRCPCIAVGRTSFAKTLHSARALVPTTDLGQIVETFRIAKSIKGSCTMAIASSFLIKYGMIAAIYFLKLPFIFGTLAISGCIVLEALIARSSLGENRATSVPTNSDQTNLDEELIKISAEGSAEESTADSETDDKSAPVTSDSESESSAS